LNKIPKNIKYSILGISILMFFILNSVLGVTLIISSIQLIHKITGFYFGISTHFIDYLVFASFPVFGMLFNSKRNDFKFSELLKDIFTILCWIIIVVAIGLYILTIINSPTNPLIPKYLIAEPFNLFSPLIIGIGILIPFLFIKRTEKQSEIKNIETDN